MKKFIYSSLAIILLFISQGAFAQENEINRLLPSNPDIKTGILDNGLKYYIRHNKKPENKVELRLVVNAGSVLEDKGQEGLAHFMEHMNFNGLKHFPANEIVHYLQSIGVAFGNDLNAYTSFDETVYILPVPTDKAGKLDSAFLILSDWSGAALLTPEEIEKERGVILAESRIGKGADDRMMKKWLPALLNGSKYGERLPIGIDSVIASFEPSTLIRFYRDWYRPNQQAVIVIGDIPVELAEKYVIDNFSGFTNPDQIRERPAIFEVKAYDHNTAMVLSDPEADNTSITIYGNPRPRPAIKTEGDYFNSIIEELVTNMMNSRFNELRFSADPPFVYAYGYTGGFVRGYENFSLMAVCGSTEINKATNVLVSETMRIKKFGFTDDELVRAKASLLSSYERRFNERSKMESGRLTYELVSHFLSGDAIPGIEWEFKFIKENIERITLETLKPVYNKMDIDERYFALVTAKEQPGLPTDSEFEGWIESALSKDVEPYSEKKLATSLLEKEPVAGKIKSTQKNEKLGTTTYTLSNNTSVCIKPTDFKNDEVLLKAIRFGGNSTYEGDDYQSAQLSSGVIDAMGFGSFSNSDLTKFLAGKTVSVRPAISDFTETIDATSNLKDLETMFQLLYLKATSPRYDENAFRSFIARSKQSVESTRGNPQYLFMDSSYNVLYGGHKRAHVLQSAADYDKINATNAVDFYKNRMGNASGMHYIIVGSFTESQILPLIEKYIGGLPASDFPAMYKDLGMNPVTGNQSFTLRKGSEQQAMLNYFLTGKLPYSVEDNFLLEQLNAIVNNKIIDGIREEMSAIYGGGVSGSLKKYPKEEFMIRANFPCGPDNIVAIDTAFMGIIDRLKLPGGITEADLKKVREPALEHDKVNLKENRYWLNALQAAHLNKTDPERIIRREQMLKEIKPEQLTNIARKFYTKENVFKAEWLPELVR